MARARGEYRARDKRRNAERRAIYGWIAALAAIFVLLLIAWFAFGMRGATEDAQAPAVEQPDVGEGGGGLPAGDETL